MPLLKRRHEKSSPPDALQSGVLFVGTDDIQKRVLDNRVKLIRISGILFFLGLLGIFLSSSEAQQSTQKKLKSSQEIPSLSEASSKYGTCRVSFQPPPAKKSWDTKPLWLAAFPGSGSTGPAKEGDILKPLINSITGLKAGAKFYHASSKILKRCKGRDETAVCSQAHPAVPINPEKQVDNFHHSVLLLIRNFKSVYPTFFNDKAKAYHGVNGQVNEEEWRKNRDEYYKSVFEGWKTLVMAWKEMREYDIALYIQYEALMDPDRGPDVLGRIADQLQSAGFAVAPKKDIPCIWYQVFKEEAIRLHDFMEYTPGFTLEQRDYLLKELEKFQTEVSDDDALVAILKEYYTDIRDNTRIDKLWENKTAG